MHRLRAAIVVGVWSCFFTGTAVCGPQDGNAENDEQFSALMMAGVDHYRAGSSNPSEFRVAIEYFERAQKIKDLPDIQYNIARAYHQLGECDTALAKYRQYALTSVENARVVQKYIEELSKTCGTAEGSLALQCTPSDAQVSIDGAPTVLCTGSHILTVGEHEVVVRAPGYEESLRKVAIDRRGQEKKMAITMDKAVLVQEDIKNSVSDASVVSTLAQNGKERGAWEKLEDQSALFWSGIGLGSGGVLFSLVGGILMGTSHHKVTHNSDDGFYERSSGKLACGGVMLGLGTAAALAGVGLVIADAVLKKDDSQAQLYRVIPAVATGDDGASAMLTVFF